jgi:RNA recognition motif-containing protein
MGQTFPPQILQTGVMRPPYFPASNTNPIEASLKDQEFAKGVYVSGFESTLTAEMLQNHFNIKPIVAMKLPLSKNGLNKGFAFVYYKSIDDASYVKHQLHLTTILKSKIKVTKIVSDMKLSKMILKIKK